MNVTDTSSRATAHAWPSGLESLLDSISEGVLLVDACADDLPIVYINRAFEELTGYRADEVFGRNCRFLQGADREQSGREVLRGATRDGRKANTLLRNYRKDGTRFWNELTIFPLRDVSGKVTHFVGVQADVTARIEPQTRLAVVSEDLKVSQAQLQATFDSMTDGVIVLDSRVNIVRLNRAAALLFDLKDAALSNQQIEAIFEVYLPDGSLLSPEQWPSTRAVWGAFSRNQEFTIRRKDSGRTVIVEISSAPVIGPSGGIGQILVTFRDITESRKVTRSRDLLAAIVESSQDAIIGKDIHGIVASWNRGAENCSATLPRRWSGSPSASFYRKICCGRKTISSPGFNRARRWITSRPNGLPRVA